jgi:XTP/dITP diphosphohydrolase
VLELLVATTNSGKLAEVRAFLAKLPLKIFALKDLTDPLTVLEDGATFEANARKKARTLAEFSGLLTLADDSGLQVDALGGAPGIFSARYAGEHGDDEQNNKKLLRELETVPDNKRTARFICALALCAPRADKMNDWIVREGCEGRIARAPSGSNGFGYDPLFFFPPFNKTFGEMDRDCKATVSHRGKALAKLAKAIPGIVDLRRKP